jgi:hypothetical protein
MQATAPSASRLLRQEIDEYVEFEIEKHAKRLDPNHARVITPWNLPENQGGVPLLETAARAGATHPEG